MAFFDFTLTDIIALGGLSIAFLSLLWQRQTARQEAARTATKLAAETEARRQADMLAISTRLATVEAHNEVIWTFLMRRAKSELLDKNLGAENSPLQLTGAALEAIRPLLSKLLPIYDAVMSKPNSTEYDVLLEFENVFGDELIDTVCKPYNLKEGACLIMALEACKAVKKSSA